MVSKIVTIFHRTIFHLPSPAARYYQKQKLKQTFVLQPSCCLSFCKYGTLPSIALFPTIYYHSELQGQTENVTTPWIYLILYLKYYYCYYYYY